MKVVVIPDIHLKPWIFDRAEEILKNRKADRAVCLMDIPDDWDAYFSLESYEETFDRAILFAKEHTETLWCYGNHDVSYPWAKLESGYSPYAESTVLQKLEELENSLQDRTKIAVVHRVDNVIFCHGGLAEDFISRLNKNMLKADIDAVISAVNNASQDCLWEDDSPLWLRPQDDYFNMFRTDIYTQVVGHTPVDQIYEENGIISTDVFSTYPDGRQVGESALIVIDTKTREYEKIEFFEEK